MEAGPVESQEEEPPEIIPDLSKFANNAFTSPTTGGGGAGGNGGGGSGAPPIRAGDMGGPSTVGYPGVVGEENEVGGTGNIDINELRGSRVPRPTPSCEL